VYTKVALLHYHAYAVLYVTILILKKKKKYPPFKVRGFDIVALISRPHCLPDNIWSHLKVHLQRCCRKKGRRFSCEFSRGAGGVWISISHSIKSVPPVSFSFLLSSFDPSLVCQCIIITLRIDTMSVIAHSPNNTLVIGEVSHYHFYQSMNHTRPTQKYQPRKTIIPSVPRQHRQVPANPLRCH
jgi:hypothetical protein